MSDTGTGTSRLEILSGEVGLAFPEYDAPPPEPMGLVRAWVGQAAERGVREALAMALATADAQGRVSNRMVAVIEVTDSGALFTTHSSSRKGRDMAATGWASGVFYWRETGQQLVLSGPVEQSAEAESDALWYGRPYPLHAMTVASRQSEPLPDVSALRDEAARLAAVDAALPRPDRYTGYRLRPSVVEFWSADPDRLHRRLRYELQDQAWQVTRLQP
ncbi:phenazine biosynthesis FMN-dependent oxidase PhzG [Actinacidiphila bryophytorum]|uniref:Dihydrophenazinedicarboxylate synthase n=1 Tax=Actinacidiphila bryophytorum TaxID=1436133 RepID=A0A9W4E2W7_9ACTN|nr:phenazine biosynthesis FMN-dependent oxidase PhzG [Actinacidiphila bryophytorum]MBM9437961.1 phenazine biosynthesis FMN-dependent oxidase PhzG [Actinacidiphila bryophytorum]MBN6543143.1 phenazine biosynthesis FMN-dependent oxidase PhzG [Actinacidiphila bryophytorum]CAG7617385.1 Dihydrophenazinedicarboxylate synthase [Actinacidiphila bryophytorum]